MALGSYKISDLLEKMQNSDKDFRFMATNDLINELEKDSIKLDDDSERKVVRTLLKLLDDKNGEVQNLVVRCLALLINKIKENQVESIVKTLCGNMVSEKEQLRDISSVGLKTVISELPHATGGLSENICKRITACLTTAIEKQDVPVQLEALDILADLLSRFGDILNSFDEQILSAILPQLKSQRQAVRKRTIVACGCLVLTCSPALYNKLIDHLYEVIHSKKNTAEMRTYIQCISAVCRQSRQKFGKHIERFVLLILEYSKDEDEELREICLQTFESFIYCCPKEITPHLPQIISLCSEFVAYDPNYNYESDEDEKHMDTDEEEEDPESDPEEYSDNDDISWKIRRASAKCLETIISSRHELLSDFYKSLSPILISRFKEREENVKCDIFHAYIALLKQTKSSIALNIDPDTMDEEEIPVHLLQKQVPDIVKAIYLLVREKSIKTRQNCFLLIKETCYVLQGAFSEQIGKIIPGILYSLNEKNSSSSLKIEALSTIYCLLTTHPPDIFYPHMTIILPAIVKAVDDSFYKISSEALNVLQELIKIIRPVEEPMKFDVTPYVADIFNCTLVRLRTSDIDQEVKDKAISTMGYIICHMGDILSKELDTCWVILLDRLKNEITRLTTVKALTKIVSSPFKLDIPIIREAIPVLGSFLRKNQRSLKQSTLVLLDALLKNTPLLVSPDLLRHVLVELPTLLDPSDLYVTQWTLAVLTSIIKQFRQTISADYARNTTQLVINNLLLSPLLQGGSLKATLDYFEAIVESKIPGTSYKELLSILFKTSENNLHKQVYYSVGKCIARVTLISSSNTASLVRYLLQNTKSQEESDTSHMFALIVLGEIGRNTDLSFTPNLAEDILYSFVQISEEIKFAASFALGSIAIGSLQKYLPFILQQIESQVRLQYLLLHSLKEVIVSLSDTQAGIQQLVPYVPAIWQQLFYHCESNEEGTRNVVAECLGKLTLIDPVNLLPKLQESVRSPSPLVRSTVVTAFKFTITDHPREIDPMLRQSIGQFLNTLQDPDMNVRHVALCALNSAAHNKPLLIRDLLTTILPLLYNETKVKKELIREVEMGPFKHTVDDGLDMRKAAFECMYTLIDSCFDRIDVFEYLTHIEEGLRDHYDIKTLTYLMVARLAQKCPGAILQRMDRIIEPLRDTCNMKLKVNAVKQEHEKQEELKRSAMRAVQVLLTIPDADKNPHISGFVLHIKHSSDLNVLFESIQKDS